MTTKQCHGPCGLVKPLDEFRLRSERSTPRPACRACEAAERRERNAQHRLEKGLPEGRHYRMRMGHKNMPCVNGCGQPSGESSPYCIPCELAGRAGMDGSLWCHEPDNSLPERIQTYEVVCLMCADLRYARGTEQQARVTMHQGPRCGRCGGLCDVRPLEQGSIGGLPTDVPQRVTGGHAWKPVPRRLHREVA